MNVAYLFWQACEKEGGRVAIATETTQRSFAQLGARVGSLTHGLSRLGVNRGDRVAICGRNSLEFIEAFWAVMSLGAVAIPLNFRLAPKELEHLCRYSDVKLHICSVQMLEQVRAAEFAASGREKPVVAWGGAVSGGVADFNELADIYGPVPIVADVRSADASGIIFTGGTSGTPKGVVRSHRNAIVQLLFAPGNDLLGVSRTVMACTPFFHIAGQIALFAPALGSAVVMIDGSFSGEKFLRLVEQFQVAAAFVVPAMVTEIAGVDERIPAKTDSLRELRSGGAPLPLEVAQRLVRRFPTIRFSNGGGSTEAGTMASGWWDELSSRDFGCLGRPPIGQEIRIVNDSGEDCDSGELGEILVRGGQVSQGYWGKTAQESCSNDGWQHSADVGKLDDEGFVYLLDRKSELIISGGENIYAREVEEVLYRCSLVKEVAVIGVPDEKWGETPLAIVSSTNPGSVVEELQRFAGEWLASYKRPRKYLVVDALPRTAVGKIDKKALRALVK